LPSAANLSVHPTGVSLRFTPAARDGAKNAPPLSRSGSLDFNPSISWNGFSIDIKSSFSYYLFSEKGVCILFLAAFSPLKDQEAFSQ